MIEDKSLKVSKGQYIKTSTNKIEANLPYIIELEIVKMKKFMTIVQIFAEMVGL